MAQKAARDRNDAGGDSDATRKVTISSHCQHSVSCIASRIFAAQNTDIDRRLELEVTVRL